MERTTLNCRGRVVVIEKPLVMGILNLTPDSFYDGGVHEFQFLERVNQMIVEGATIIDIGAMSSRPGSAIIPKEEEKRRLLEPLKSIRKAFPDIIISLDTVRAEIAEMGISEGVDIINDISAGAFEPDIWDIVSKNKVPYILMHMQGTPEIMQLNPQYQNVVNDVMQFFVQKVNALLEKGVKDIILDPGFGFGKNTEHNYQLLKSLSKFKLLNCPMLVGISRKSMINKVLNIKAKEALNGTTALHMLALEQGASILRVHDVKEAVQCIELYHQYSLS